MDIEYLLWLQNLREASGNVLTPFMQFVSDSVVTWLVLVPLFVYWCVNKRAGLFLLYSMTVGYFINDMLKLTFCVPRPYLRDVRVIPPHRSSGYSFPSGHSELSASILGGIGVLARKREVWLSWLCALGVVLVMFSRNYLGVHTPQDVIVGALLGIFTVWLASKLVAASEKSGVAAVALLVFCAAGAAYAALKPYPADLADPLSMSAWFFIYGGMVAGLAIGSYFERRYINFKAAGFNFRGLALSFVGLMPYYLMYPVYTNRIAGALSKTLTAQGGYFALGFMAMIYTVVLWPLVIKKFCE